MCERHANHWFVRKLYVWLGLLFWFGLLILLVAFSLPEELKAPVIGFCVFGPLIWLVAGLILVNNAIRAAEIDHRGVKITNVNRQFAKEWEINCDEMDSKPKAKKKKLKEVDEWEREEDDE